MPKIPVQQLAQMMGIANQDLVFKLISPLRPGLIQSGDAGGFIYLVIPIRLNV